MKCRFCPCRVDNSNEIDGYQPNGCFYGDDYLDDYCYEDKDGDCCCDKTKDEIENDIEDYQEYMRYEEEVLAEEMERQRIANYDFERGKSKSTGSRNAGKRTGRKLGGHERQGRIKNEIYSKF